MRGSSLGTPSYLSLRAVVHKRSLKNETRETAIWTENKIPGSCIQDIFNKFETHATCESMLYSHIVCEWKDNKPNFSKMMSVGKLPNPISPRRTNFRSGKKHNEFLQMEVAEKGLLCTPNCTHPIGYAVRIPAFK